jgi:DNA (cytosine-5)-methyltransferase 1
MKYGSLFAGIGGIDLGLDRAGMECAWQVERDPYCLRVLQKHWPRVPKLEDVRDVGKHNLAPVDLIAGGFPCQDISFAGKGAGLAGDRSGLWYEFARIIGELGPQYVLVENVSALLTRGIGEVLGTLASLGYDAEWHCVPASYVGAPHRRDRIFIVAYSVRERLEGLKQAGATPGATHRPGHGCDPGWWSVEPDVGRVAHGIPRRVDRLRGLGNAVVPQVAELVGRWIMQREGPGW